MQRIPTSGPDLNTTVGKWNNARCLGHSFIAVHRAANNDKCSAITSFMYITISRVNRGAKMKSINRDKCSKNWQCVFSLGTSPPTVTGRYFSSAKYWTAFWFGSWCLVVSAGFCALSSVILPFYRWVALLTLYIVRPVSSSHTIYILIQIQSNSNMHDIVALVVYNMKSVNVILCTTAFRSSVVIFALLALQSRSATSAYTAQ